jgi:hypothetical protein
MIGFSAAGYGTGDDDDLAKLIAEHDRLMAEAQAEAAVKAKAAQAEAAQRAAVEAAQQAAAQAAEPEPQSNLAEVIGEGMAMFVHSRLEPLRKEIDSLRLEQARLLGQIDVLTAMARPAEPKAGEVVDLPRLGWRGAGH